MKAKYCCRNCYHCIDFAGVLVYCEVLDAEVTAKRFCAKFEPIEERGSK